MQLQTPFDATLVDPSQGAGSLPVGKHPAMISASEFKQNNAQDGAYLQLDLTITDGPAKGQTGADRLNLYHTKQQTVEIAQKRLSAYCHVTGVFKVSDTAQLHNIPFIIEVDYQKGQGPAYPTGPENKNYTEVKRLFDINGNEPGKKPANAAPQPAAPGAFPAQNTALGAPSAPAWANPAQPVQTPPPAAAAAQPSGWNPTPTAPAPWSQQTPQPAAPAAPWSQAPSAPAGNKPPWG